MCIRDRCRRMRTSFCSWAITSSLVSAHIGLCWAPSCKRGIVDRGCGERGLIHSSYMLRTQGERSLARIDWLLLSASLLIVIGVAASATAQAPPQGPQVVSPEVTADRRIVLRVLAPQAQTVKLNASDIPGVPFGQSAPAMIKGANGVWEMTVGPVPAGAYRYSFMIDGVATIDPRNPSTSESNNNSWSLVYVAGSDAFDTRNVPHGSVAEVHYYSTALKAFRRMHVYTPPGYETSSKKYPVFYLLHGAGDSDDSWSTVGRAGFILDNLIASKSAKPMVVVMPAGHTGPFRTGGPRPAVDEFSQDFLNDILPHVEKNYRVYTCLLYTSD